MSKKTRHFFCNIATKRVNGDVARFTTSRIQTCLATNQVAVGCEKFVAESREFFYFLRQNLYVLRVLPA